MRHAILLPIVLACAPFAVRPASAQQAEPAAATGNSDRVQRAIAEYEALRADPKDAARTKQALLWLGEIDDAAVTVYLQKALAAAGVGPAAVPILQAIAKVPRPQLQQDLWNTLHGGEASEAVRVAAAVAIGKCGERGIDKLLEIVHGPADATTPRARESALGVLIDSGHDRALRSLAPMLLEGPMADRLKLLRRMEKVRGIYPIDAARIRLVTEGTIDVAAVAWRQLAIGGHERARGLAVDMLERLVEEPRPAIAAELIGGIVSVRDPDLYPVLLRFGSVAGDVVRNALRAAAPAAARDHALVDFLINKGLESDTPTTREVARLLLAEAPAEAIAPLLAKVRTELKAGRKKAIDLAISLHDLLARDPSWRSDLLALAGSPETEVKIVGLSLLLEIGADNAIAIAQKCLAHREWELRSVAYRYLTKCRDVSSIPLLIARVDHEDGRLAAELATALFVHTGTRRAKEKEWLAWWEANRTGFALPHPEAVRAGGTSTGGKTITYHGIPLTSRHASFLIDFSGSMLEKIGTDRKHTRLDEAKAQFTRVIGEISEDHHVNLITFAGQVQQVWDKLRRATPQNREELLDALAKAAPTGGTNIFDALETAFHDTTVDTIYLLTDGEPTVGRLVNPDEICEEVERWNTKRQIVIHAISIGTNSSLLRRLAEGSGGVYKFVR